MERKKRICESCINNFHKKRFKYYISSSGRIVDKTTGCTQLYENFIKEEKDINEDFESIETPERDEFCIYTHLYEDTCVCNYYNKPPCYFQLTKVPKIIDDDDGDSYQDGDRTFTTSERQLSVRLDCRNGQREAA